MCAMSSTSTASDPTSPNCGRHDDGGKSEGPYRLCAAQTFNNGRFVNCQPCSSCPPNHQKLSECNATTDTQCCGSRDQTGCWKEALGTTTQQVQRSTTLRVQMSTSNPTKAKHIDTTFHGDSATSHVNHQTAWIVLTVILVLSVLAFLLFIYIKKRRSRAFCFRDNILYTNQKSRSSRRTAAVNEEVALLQSETRSLEDILSPDLQSAPLQTVLDNLDVLEELVILLDPESPGVKNTSHLASRCSFPATWITYTYSLRDSKSPLRAVLEGVTTKHPDWTVGQLARLLREMDRNDAVVVLTKLTLPKVV
ncbi:transmembrane protein 149 isoform X1 [Salmo salar]|uniref:Transmembrane protein 149 isoform X1 n=1 Tax=Salmo salar TaxID=8030 RepID=A0A1S3RX85_SALSA|nr:transmembrane protein 149 isoform X1 [Salmo salar]|eukprot:XP_014056861.1 PREDICTED: transmembrane protein 149 isoform X1 [Salmo salar]